MVTTLTPTVEEAARMKVADIKARLPSKAQLEPMKAVEVVREMNALHRLLDYLEESKKLANELYDSCRFSMVPRAMENEGIEGFKVEGVGRVSLTSDMRVTIPAAVKATAYEWLEDQGSGDLISQTVNAQTLAAFVKKRLREGKDVPSELFTQSPFTRATISKG